MASRRNKPTPSEARAQTSQRSYHKGNVAEGLLAACERLLKKERVEDISVRRLTREVGVTPGNFYNHFPNLDHLLLTLAARGFRQTTEMGRSIRAKARTRGEAAKLVAVDFVEFAVGNKQMFRIMFGQIPNAIAHAEFKMAADEGFGELIVLVYGENRFDPDDVAGSHQRAIVAYAFWAMIYGLARNIVEDQFQFATGSRQEIRRFVESAVEAFIDGSAPKQFQQPVVKN